MGLDWVFADSGRGVIYLTSTVLRPDDILDLYRRVEPHLAQARYILADATKVRDMQADRQGMQRVADCDLRFARKYPGKVFAIAATDDLTFGMSRMYAALASASDWQVAVFRDLETAQAWIRERLGAEGRDLTFR